MAHTCTGKESIAVDALRPDNSSVEALLLRRVSLGKMASPCWHVNVEAHLQGPSSGASTEFPAEQLHCCRFHPPLLC